MMKRQRLFGLWQRMITIEDKYLRYMRQLLPCYLTVYELHEVSGQPDISSGYETSLGINFCNIYLLVNKKKRIQTM
jgi:hypothetical protein